MTRTRNSSATVAFAGFHSPNYTSVPDEFFDELPYLLSGAEFKVAAYIIRRTFGFKKQSDSISLSQMVSGITTRDGRVLDRGAGVTRSTAVAAIKGLLDKGVIVANRNRSKEKGNEATTYAVRFWGEPVAEAHTPPSMKIELGLVRKSNQQQTGVQQTARETTFESAHTQNFSEENEDSTIDADQFTDDPFETASLHATTGQQMPADAAKPSEVGKSPVNAKNRRLKRFSGVTAGLP